MNTLIYTILFLSLIWQFTLTFRQIQSVQRNRDHVPEPFTAQITLEAHQKAADYTVAKSHLGIVSTVVGFMVMLWFTVGGGIAYIGDVISPHFHGIWHSLAVIVCIAIISSIIQMPFQLVETFHIERRFGFNRMTVKLYLLDLARMILLAIVIGLPLLTIVLWLLEQTGSLWWLWTFCVWAGFSLLMMWIYPTWIAPLFNKFTPLSQENLREHIEKLMQQCGFQSSGIFVMDGSKRSSHGNAYFTGFGKTKRIVFFDTLLTQMKESEIIAILAHELGHFKLGHIPARLSVAFGYLFIQMAILAWLITQPAWSDLFHLSIQQPALVLLATLLVWADLTFLLHPLTSLLSRRHEFQADAFAAQQTNAQDLITALTVLYRENASTLTPDAWYSYWHASHPPALQRIHALQHFASNAVPL